MLGYKNDLTRKNFVYFYLYNRWIKLNYKFRRCYKTSDTQIK